MSHKPNQSFAGQFLITYISSVFLKFRACYLPRCVFIIFISSIKFWEQNINQSETRICDTKLSLEMYELGKALDDSIGNIPV